MCYLFCGRNICGKTVFKFVSRRLKFNITVRSFICVNTQTQLSLCHNFSISYNMKKNGVRDRFRNCSIYYKSFTNCAQVFRFHFTALYVSSETSPPQPSCPAPHRARGHHHPGLPLCHHYCRVLHNFLQAYRVEKNGTNSECEDPASDQMKINLLVFILQYL